MQMDKREKLMKKVENHLRMTARKLVKFDTEGETLQYLIDSFRSEFQCDFVGIIMKEEDLLVSKANSGDSVLFIKSLPLNVGDCSSNLLYTPLTFDDMVMENDQCALIELLKKEEMNTWFTVPLIDEGASFGFCIIGFKNNIRLIKEMDSMFIEFGKDVATAIRLASKKESEKRKILDVEWISRNLSLNSSLEKVVEKVVDRAGKGTSSKFACIYLYNEHDNSFNYQPPSYGEMNVTEKININNYVLNDYFPYIEKVGGPELTVPLVVDLKTIGVLHVGQKGKGKFSEEDLELLELLASHVASMLENAKLYNDEKNHKIRLHSLLEYQQKLVLETVKPNSFDGITKIVSHYFSKNVILFDRFIRPISYHLQGSKMDDLSYLFEKATVEIVGTSRGGGWLQLENNEKSEIIVWPINDGIDLLGYLAIEKDKDGIDEFDQIGIDLVLNIYSSQFVKQKLILDAKEQVKDSFINKILVKSIKEPDSIIQYANLFNWNLFDHHRVAVLSLVLEKDEATDENILEKEARKSILWERLKKRITIHDNDIQVANKKDEYILIVPIAKEMNKPKVFWSSFYERVKKWAKEDHIHNHVFMGIGGITKGLEDYYSSYQQALQTLNVVNNRFRDTCFALFDELGGYALLHGLKNSSVTNLFTSKYIDPLLKYSKEKNADLFHTLRVFLNNHGNLSKTSNDLFIHRSSLLYRIERIESLLEIDLNDPDHRFNIMLAYRLYDLFYSAES
ncbi:helix-turn-helix domain-containing protein [Schinkia azotoformans]|uniref:GAF domain-containing protein n=1 Tax=Schinkia azotoformans LMG 9581 TaxID=1131731 RepID=K6CAJ6_SCHAZ|nr:helix-turn-helix domain-containing protein [Schinkia azotoformans]EKN68145.1 hypothetical protein BAZO_06514 [Schinkia azotoformans LMG 9581]MEC1638045.1 helix-turn-helix domain-containing protein [Schinkia azotoformans]MEC1946521.1 helix-turn-helix domain-containing protein [Schinkia azotoformans]